MRISVDEIRFPMTWGQLQKEKGFLILKIVYKDPNDESQHTYCLRNSTFAFESLVSWSRLPIGMLLHEVIGKTIVKYGRVKYRSSDTCCIFGLGELTWGELVDVAGSLNLFDWCTTFHPLELEVLPEMGYMRSLPWEDNFINEKMQLSCRKCEDCQCEGKLTLAVLDYPKNRSYCLPCWRKFWYENQDFWF